MKYSTVIFFVLSVIFISCKENKIQQKSKSDSSVKKLEKSEPAENFDEFNKKFHSDSVFQVSRVDFPIEGKHVSGFEQYDWNRKNWQFQAVPVAEKTEIGEYQHSLVQRDTLITERFWIPDSGFEVERQFKLIGNKWFLIYYNDINL
jgi:hypothetical protein